MPWPIRLQTLQLSPTESAFLTNLYDTVHTLAKRMSELASTQPSRSFDFSSTDNLLIDTAVLES